ncbi:tRNA (guanine-N1)-methyltransferase [Confluentibacter flavum]|uniref:tRNA (Guanine-N1)-methyltransferase n=1 Tax=Confluentibacter flavum TaxID=1909700 RepID=A0A2N3HIQ0_9FLAO|nr:tRNA (guanine-N1)-methyltransferase [Confluentibacter flavum]PKQ44845.1 tRNA (guanine-N1)-methyltransferase [Confluentibacter flavum]
MKCIKYLLVIAVLLTCSFTAFSQNNTEEDELSLDKGSIDNQFEYVITRSNNYQDFKVVKKTWLYTLKAHTIDSLKAVHNDLADTKILVDTQAKEISDLKSSLESTQANLENTRSEKDNIGLFGAQMSKGSYKTIMWLIIGCLLALLALFIYKFNNSNAITRQAKKNLADIEEEFEEHRKTAVEREQKVRRQLQDEINKQKTTKGNK